MTAPEQKKPTHRLKDLKWGYSLDDLLYLVEEDKLQICKQQRESLASFFDSDEVQEEASKFSKDPIPIYEDEARKIEQKYGMYADHSEPISLVITEEEKERFEKDNNLIVGVDQEELDAPLHPPEKLPTIIMGPDDDYVHGYEKIGKKVNCHKDNVLKLHREEGLPLFWSGTNPYSTIYRLAYWFENREGKKRETAKNFTKTKNPQEK